METPAPITVQLNGEPRSLPHPMTVEELLVHLGLEGLRVAVELDGAVVSRAARGEARVEDGATLEVVHFVGGGQP